ncbi:MAG: hypothetical protein ACK4E1_07105 [Fervidobacterium nodosum]
MEKLYYYVRRIFDKAINFLNLIIKKKNHRKVITLAIIHFDGMDLKRLINEFRAELKSADIIIGKNLKSAELKKNSIQLKGKNFIFLNKDSKEMEISGQMVDFIDNFDVKKLRSFERRGVKVVTVNDKKTAWMISQMFAFYCVVPSEPFQECVITSPIPLTRNSDGYYFTKIAYRNQVTLVDLNIEILNDFRNPQQQE